ncbi:hypothetical protein VE03_06435 [Pseudogymnoascus sp. 23342-1-I1]|nr:hypothetical protein VE03_06435 [Pseudogymnoascus sp. 23342-1-I1]
MRLSLCSISVLLYLFHGVLGGVVKFEGGFHGDIVTCTSKVYDDETLANFLENEVTYECTRVGNNFVVNDPFFKCDDDNYSAIVIACEGPIDGDATCVTGFDKARSGL